MVVVFDVLIAMLDVLTLAGTYLQIGVNCTFKNMANLVLRNCDIKLENYLSLYRFT